MSAKAGLEMLATLANTIDRINFDMIIPLRNRLLINRVGGGSGDMGTLSN